MRTVGPAGRSYQCDVAADRVRAVVKTLQSCASADGRSADAVVGDGELEHLWCSSQRYLDLMGACLTAFAVASAAM